MQYCNTKVGSLPEHKFAKYLTGDERFVSVQQLDNHHPLHYAPEVFVDNFMLLVILMLRKQMMHITTVVMTSKYDVFPEDQDDTNDRILLKKIKKGESQFLTCKILLGFSFYGEAKSIFQKMENGRSYL